MGLRVDNISIGDAPRGAIYALSVIKAVAVAFESCGEFREIAVNPSVWRDADYMTSVPTEVLRICVSALSVSLINGIWRTVTKVG